MGLLQWQVPPPCPHRACTTLGWVGGARAAAYTISCPALGWVWVCWVCLGWGQGCRGSGMGTGLSWIWDGSVLGLDGSRMGLSWVWDKPGVGLS